MSTSNGNPIYLPELRRDLQIIPITDNGRELLYFHDSLGYTPQDFALRAAAKPLLTLFNGRYRISDLLQQPGTEIDEQELQAFIHMLDDACLLMTPTYNQRVDEVENRFEKNSVRESSMAGFVYPAETAQFKVFFDRQFDQFKDNHPAGSSYSALYAPHIDIRVGSKEYIDSFIRLKEIKPKKVLILATSHYAGNYGSFYDGFPFIGSLKTYKIPGRLFNTDRQILNRLNRNSDSNGFTLADRAHRVEHSIETHLVYMSAIWDHDFEIIPILVGSLDQLFYHQSGDLAEKTERFTAELKSILQSEDELFTFISGDLSHVGRKFGDALPASEMKEKVSTRDMLFLESAKNGSPDQLLDLLSSDVDSTRICGFPPLYIYLKAAQKSRGKLVNYEWWDEKERESAVSYGSILY